MSKQQFNAEVGRLLEIMAHALYSEREIFVRELIANAADAIEKRRYMAIEKPQMATSDDLRIIINSDNGQLTIQDNGIGMSQEELIENLGTIARSGTKKFLESVKNKDNNDFIGQFGVGFYSSFMVANWVKVYSRKAGEDSTYCWQSNGQDGYDIAIADTPLQQAGTKIIVDLKDDAKEFGDKFRISAVVRKWSDYIPVPIIWGGDDEQLNQAVALWRQEPSSVNKDDYRRFYNATSFQFDEPFVTIHTRAEGIVNYNALLFIPQTPPHDLFSNADKSSLKLYIKRMFITDNLKGILPRWLRFVSGVIESDDIPLNISREMLQMTPVLNKIRQVITKRILTELQKKLNESPAIYDIFYEKIGRVMKEAMMENDTEMQALVIALMRIKTQRNHDYINFADYEKMMLPGQEDIYYLVGYNEGELRASPHLEGFNARNIPVVLLTDPVDNVWVQQSDFNGKKFKPINAEGVDLSKFPRTDGKNDDATPETSPDITILIGRLKDVYGPAVKDVIVSKVLSATPVRLVTPEGAPDANMQQILRSLNQAVPDFAPVLEINPNHRIIAKLAKQNTLNQDEAKLLLDLAKIQSNIFNFSEAEFAQRLQRLLEQ